MRRLSAVLFTLLFLARCSSGDCELAADCAADQLCRLGECVARNVPPPPAPKTPLPVWPERSTAFLWQIEGAAPTYLLGTIHVGVDPAGFPAAVYGALDSSSTLVIEADIRLPIDPATLDRYAQLPAELSLDQLLPADVWTMLVTELQGRIAAADLRRLEPWYVALLLGPSTANLPTMEPALLQRAQAQGKPLGFLETAEDQFSAIDQVPREVWIDEITLALNDPAAAQQSFQDLVSSYLDGDAAAISALALGNASIDDILLRMRNQNWIPQIEALHADSGGFVAVGVAHLLGSGSVIELLRTRGSTVSAVRLDGTALRELGAPQHDVALPPYDPRRPDLAWPWF